jgi:hypothetical protein
MDPKDPKDNPFLRLAEGEPPIPEESQEPEVEASIEPEPEPSVPDWRTTTLPDTDEFYGRLRGKKLEDADRVLRQLEDEKRRAETERNLYERQTASLMAQVQFLQSQMQPRQAEPQAPQAPKFEVTVDEIAERPNEFAEKLIRAAEERILPIIEQRLNTSRTEVDTKLEQRTVVEKLREATGKAFREIGIPEEDFKDTYDELLPIIQQELTEEGALFKPESWKKAAEIRRERVARRYGLAPQAPQPAPEAPAPAPQAPPPPRPPGNFGPAVKAANKPGVKVQVSSTDREVYESVGKSLGIAGDELEDFVIAQAEIRQGLRERRRNAF